jgi:hypothetical protein
VADEEQAQFLEEIICHYPVAGPGRRDHARHRAVAALIG